MKIIYFIIAIIILSGCGKHMYSTMSSGKEDLSYIIVLKGNNNYTGSMAVQIDEQKPVPVTKVYKTKMQRKAQPIPTTPGKHILKVIYNGQILSTENVFLGLQETKKIILP